MNNEEEVNQICKEMQEKAMKSVKASLGIKSSDFNYFNNSEKFSQLMKHQNIHSLQMLSSLIANENRGHKVEKLDDDEDKFDFIREINDNMFDRIGNYLDEASGLKKKDAQLILATLNTHESISTMNSNLGSTSSWNRNIIKAKRVGTYHLLSAKMIPRSQLKFKDKIVNNNSPFVPIIKEKPNSIKPLSILPEIDDEGNESYSHPYELEIEKFEPNDRFLDVKIPKMPKSVSESKFKFISTQQELIQMCEQLKCHKEIAIDLEHHSYRTFQGFTCLMQISDSETDYVIDTLELRSEMFILNEVFTSPAILKVFHGADMDIVWLQRDFGIYVVNMFDTCQAAKLLNFPHLSLSYLLKHYCNLEADKKFQLADWRIRPLNVEMIKYAREDTHYLIFIFEQMKNELISKGNTDKNLVRAVFDRSKLICLKKYEKPTFHSDSYQSLLKKSRVCFNQKQMYALKELFAWRDRMARNEDESIGYVLPNHMLMHIAEVLPREQQGILACCNPIPPLVKQQLNEIHLIILKARGMASNKSSETPTQEMNISRIRNQTIDLDDAIQTQHDFLHLDRQHNVQTLLDEFSEDVQNQQTLLNKSLLNNNSSSFIKFFENKLSTNNNDIIQKISAKFISQFEKFELSNERRIERESEMEESLKNENKSMTDSKNRVYSHYLDLASDPKLVDSDLSVKVEIKEQSEPQVIQLSVISSETKLENKPKIEKQTNKSNTNEGFNTSLAKNIEPFNYNDFDYSTFSSDKNSDNTSKKSKHFSRKKAHFKKRGEGKSFTYNPNNKKQKF